MATIKIGDDAGNYDLDVLSIDLATLKDTKYRSYDLTSKNNVDTLTLYQDRTKSNSLELVGSFNEMALMNGNIVKGVKEVTTLSVTESKHLSYSISDIEMTGADLKDKGTFADFLLGQTYKILGNDGNNVLAAGDLADQLYGDGGNDKLEGLGGRDKLFGGTGKDILLGGDQDDQLDGGTGNDKLTGAAGKDTLKGGDDNDTYFIDKYDSVVETKKGGTDAVVSDGNIDLRKFDFVENITLTGTKALSGIGDTGNNTIAGNAGANTLWGGKGVDTLHGGSGADIFQFVKGDGKDTILDFDASGRGQDHIDLGDFGSHLKYNSLDIEKLGKHDVSINFGHGDVLVLHDVSIKDIDASDFQF
jgi:Ca2+-binding RTX toxin-like protein